MFGITPPIFVLGRKKKRAIRRAAGLIVAAMLTNQNGKTVYNHKAGADLGLTLSDVYKLRSILPKGKKKGKMPKYENPPKPPKKRGGAHQPIVDNTTKPPKG